MKYIEEVRSKYDYLHEMIEGHITLVFPFESDLAKDEIVEALKPVVENWNKFVVTTAGISKVSAHGHYLFLDIDKGEDEIVKLHQALYQGVLSEHQPDWTKNGGYRVHMTLGRLMDESSLNDAYEAVKDFNKSFEIEIDRIYIEEIGDDESSVIEAVIEMQPSK